MTHRARRICSEPGCPRIAVAGGRCELHQRPRPARAPDTRQSAARRGYDARWRQIRAQYLAAHPTCAQCGGVAEEVHHIIALADGGTNHWDNLMALCKRCHSQLTDRLNGGGWGRRGGAG